MRGLLLSLVRAGMVFGTIFVNITPRALVAASVAGRKHLRHTSHLRLDGKKANYGSRASRQDEDDGDNDDVDEEDSYDDSQGEDEESKDVVDSAKTSSTLSSSSHAPAAAAPEDFGTTAHQLRLQDAVRAANDALQDNLKHQVALSIEIKQLDDVARSDGEIQKSESAIANETQSPAVASFLGDMWKEMRAFAKPFYKEHLEEKLAALTAKVPSLQAEFSRSKAELTAWTPRVVVPKASKV
eukprot:TRINITY_DN23439_c0_g3_i1.p1 TRINITY_DN23439_c0_g3~~TRINITY_DN23439_c0_g3_i1.p1  ORF type:complete len:241 (+),score=47.43 TRINITY_DN23439_c0_g3_i1:72-794(+)